MVNIGGYSDGTEDPYGLDMETPGGRFGWPTTPPKLIQSHCQYCALPGPDGIPSTIVAYGEVDTNTPESFAMLLEFTEATSSGLILAEPTLEEICAPVQYVRMRYDAPMTSSDVPWELPVAQSGQSKVLPEEYGKWHHEQHLFRIRHLGLLEQQQLKEHLAQGLRILVEHQQEGVIHDVQFQRTQ
jgi:hypothetical protein